MSSETSMVVANFRLQEWVIQIGECQGCPTDISVEGWCANHSVTTVQADCLEGIQ